MMTPLGGGNKPHPGGFGAPLAGLTKGEPGRVGPPCALRTLSRYLRVSGTVRSCGGRNPAMFTRLFTTIAGAGISFAITAVPACAADDIEAKAQMCDACHGQNGV